MKQDEPDYADEYTISMQVDDVIVTATDGVFDNLFNYEILAIVKSYYDDGGKLELTKQ
eukprot:CAMPEP_0116882036 /NCGR_PEP_ID=MMETSP0463-20121206/14176_1 /TAXON_ID=181622 /ORGANISM="Strombidinopsis sp, Strain SopsisLIS2011" /LENGTH=57 /DNA_ID=CAMNT_0004534635 /DNA_START=1040 /DNA_END=1213 /DNA_ORIENTATION=-